MDDRRLSALWRVAVVMLACGVVAGVIGYVANDDTGLWALLALAALGIVAVVLVVRHRPRPFTQPTTRRYDYRALAEAVRRVQRGEPVEPPQMQAEALDAARRTLWAVCVQLVWQPLLGALWVVQSTEPAFGSWLGIVGGVWLVATTAGVVFLGLRRRRLGALDGTGVG